MNNVKCQNLVISSFKIRMKHKFSLSINHFIVSILVSYAFCFTFQYNIVTILINAIFRGAALLRGEALIRKRHLFQCEYTKVCRFLEGGTYLWPGAYQRKYGTYSFTFFFDSISRIFLMLSIFSLRDCQFINFTMFFLKGPQWK